MTQDIEAPITAASIVLGVDREQLRHIARNLRDFDLPVTVENIAREFLFERGAAGASVFA